MKIYKLFIRQYSILKNDYVTYEKIVKTNDIYHEIGYLYCTELADIKRIDYIELKSFKKWNFFYIILHILISYYSLLS